MIKFTTEFSFFLMLLGIYIFMNHAFIPYIFIALFSALVLIERHKSLKLYKEQINLLIFSLLVFFSACVSFFYAINQMFVLETIINFAFVLLLFTFCLFYFQTEGRTIGSVKVFVYTGVVMLVYILVHPETSFERYIGDVIGNKNAVGISLAISSICSFYLFQEIKSKKYLFFTLFLTSGILLTGSRQSLLLILIGLLLIGLLDKKGLIRKFKKVITLSTISLALFVLLITNDYLYKIIGHRLTSLIEFISSDSNQSIDQSVNLRSSFISNGWSWFLDKPFLGHGIDNFKALSLEAYGTAYYSHNNYIELMVGIGVVGFIFYHLTFVYLFSILIKRQTTNKYKGSIYSLFITLLVLLLVNGVSMVNWDKTLNYIIIALVVTEISRQSYLERS